MAGRQKNKVHQAESSNSHNVSYTLAAYEHAITYLLDQFYCLSLLSELCIQYAPTFPTNIAYLHA